MFMDMMEKIKLAENNADELKKKAYEEAKSLINNTEKNSKLKAEEELEETRERAANLKSDADKEALRKYKMFVADRKRFDNNMIDDASKNKKSAVEFVVKKVFN